MSAFKTVQVLSISTALLASGGCAAFSAFDIPVIKSQPASRALPSVRWLFSRGSHVFPTAAFISSSGFAYLTYASLPPNATSSIAEILKHVAKGQPGWFLAAAILTISIAPFTSIAMIPTNFALIEKNEELGGAESKKSAAYRESINAPKRTAEESVNTKDDVSQWTDLSGPQEKTKRASSKEMDREVWELLDKFEKLNWVRAVLLGVGGVVGLMGALA